MKTERVTKGGTQRRGGRVGDRKLASPVTLFAAIEAERHAALRAIAFAKRSSLGKGDGPERRVTLGFNRREQCHGRRQLPVSNSPTAPLGAALGHTFSLHDRFPPH